MKSLKNRLKVDIMRDIFYIMLRETTGLVYDEVNDNVYNKVIVVMRRLEIHRAIDWDTICGSV